jgi:hypothetical protein
MVNLNLWAIALIASMISLTSCQKSSQSSVKSIAETEEEREAREFFEGSEREYGVCLSYDSHENYFQEIYECREATSRACFASAESILTWAPSLNCDCYKLEQEFRNKAGINEDEQKEIAEWFTLTTAQDGIRPAVDMEPFYEIHPECRSRIKLEQ